MKEENGKISYRGTEYIIVFNLNVMEEIQEEYGSVDKWAALTDGSDENDGFSVKAVKFGFRAMLNEGIEILNEENGTDLKPFTLKQVGRLISEVGLEKCWQALNDTVVKSTKSAEKNA